MRTWQLLAIMAGGSVFASCVISVGIVRLCIGSDASLPLSPRSLICGGDLNAGRVGFKRLTPEDIFITSEILESKEYTIDRGNEAVKLLDGKKNTLAAPANKSLDYRFAFIEPQRIRQTIITWGDYGTIEKYITEWRLESSEDGITWEVVQEGNSPKNKETVINKDFEGRFARITAESPEEWIGIYEVEMVGRPL